MSDLEVTDSFPPMYVYGLLTTVAVRFGAIADPRARRGTRGARCPTAHTVTRRGNVVSYTRRC